MQRRRKEEREKNRSGFENAKTRKLRTNTEVNRVRHPRFGIDPAP